MKTFGMTMLLLGGMAASAFADVKIDELLVRRKGEDVNIRVVIRNPGTTTQKGPIVIELYVRDNPSLPWDKIQTWNDIGDMKAGYKQARDFFEENNKKLRELAKDGAFEAKAVVIPPAGTAKVETVYSWKDKEAGK